MAYKKPSKVVLPRRVSTRGSVSGGLDRDRDAGEDIRRGRDNFFNQSVRTLRDLGETIPALRRLTQEEGIASTALWAFTNISNSGHRISGYDTGTNQFSAEVTQIAAGVLESMNTLDDYSRGFNDKPTVETLIERMLNETAVTSAVCAEMVLNKAMLPDRMVLVPYEEIFYRARGNNGGFYPVQVATAGDEIELDLATFFIAESKKGADESFSKSMFQGALNTAFLFHEFVDDMRRVVRETGHSRTVAKIDRERVLDFAKELGITEPEEVQDFMQKVQVDVSSLLQGLEPQDAIVTYDDIEYELLTAEGSKADYSQLLGALSGSYSTALKTHPSIMGLRLTGSQSLSNTESLVYLKLCRGLQLPVEQVLSRALTLAVRLYGMEGHVHFRFRPIDLRPEMELEAFKTMQQERVFRLLSLGLITDEDAAQRLDTGPLPAGYAPKSGTMFQDAPRMGAPSPNQDPQGRALQPSTPDRAGGESQ